MVCSVLDTLSDAVLFAVEQAGDLELGPLRQLLHHKEISFVEYPFPLPMQAENTDHDGTAPQGDGDTGGNAVAERMVRLPLRCVVARPIGPRAVLLEEALKFPACGDRLRLACL